MWRERFKSYSKYDMEKTDNQNLLERDGSGLDEMEWVDLKEENETKKRISDNSNIRREKIRIIKNILAVAVAFLLNFTAYNGLAGLQSSLHRVSGMGVINQAILYAAYLLSALFVPTFIIDKIGYKWSMVTAIVGYSTWTAANGYAVWATITPTSIIVGVAAAPLWVAYGAYYSRLGSRYAQLTRQTKVAVMSRFFGIFFFIFQLGSIIGNVISSSVLMKRPENFTEVTEEALQLCGASDCPWSNTTNSNLSKPPEKLIWTLVGVYAITQFLAVLTIIIFMDNEDKATNEPLEIGSSSNAVKTNSSDDEAKTAARSHRGHTCADLALATFTQLRNRKQQLLLPLSFYADFQGAFFMAEWTKSYIACTLGIWMVGFVITAQAVSSCLSSIIVGSLVQKVGRKVFFYTAFACDLGLLVTLLLWKPHPSQPVIFFFITGILGFTCTVWSTLIRALYGSVFTKTSEAAFSLHSICEALAKMISFAISFYLCTYIKVILVIICLSVGLACYSILEIVLWKSSKNQEKMSKTPYELEQLIK